MAMTWGVLSGTRAKAQVGTLDWVLVDESRSGREIPCEVHYPALEDGAGAIPAPGPFPTVVFGHGFVMAGGDYLTWIEGMVAASYVVITVETETGFAPSHLDFGLDLAFVANAASSDVVDLEGTMDDRVAIGGHSMGGGAAWIAAAESSEADVVFGFAPAETNPSAIGAANDVVIPALIISGSSDGITPPASQHQPIFDATSSECKSWVNLVEGSHCGFANSGSLCDFGEPGFSGMTRARQQEITLQVMTAWLDHAFYGGDWEDFGGATDVDFSVTANCAMELEVLPESSLIAWPLPFRNEVSLKGLEPCSAVDVYDGMGRLLTSSQANAQGQLKWDASTWPVGWAILRLSNGEVHKLLKLD
jgi:hypothetical protein